MVIRTERVRLIAGRAEVVGMEGVGGEVSGMRWLWKSVEKSGDGTKKERAQTEVRATPTLEARVDGFCFERQDTEDAFVDAAKRLLANEAFEGFDAQSEFAQSE